MVVDFTQHLKNPLSGEPVYRDKDSKELSTLSDICVNALITSLKGDEGMAGTTKFELWCLAKKIYNAQVDLKSEEIAKIKERVGKMYSSLMVGIAYELLEK